MFKWNSELYSKFLAERTQPAIDLARRITLDNPNSIIDLGCGPANSTRVLADRFPNSHIIGADNSEEMIEQARSSYPDLEFIIFDAQNDFPKLTQKFDVIFSNACIQWVPNHEKLITEMMNALNSGGMLAVQIPMNYSEPIHRIICELAQSDKWSCLSDSRVFHTLTVEEYYDILSELTDNFAVWQTTYCHSMPSHESIIEWYKSTGLRPYTSQLDEPHAEEFVNDVLAEVKKAYPKQKNGDIIFRFPRFFFTAKKV